MFIHIFDILDPEISNFSPAALISHLKTAFSTLKTQNFRACGAYLPLEFAFFERKIPQIFAPAAQKLTQRLFHHNSENLNFQPSAY